MRKQALGVVLGEDISQSACSKRRAFMRGTDALTHKAMLRHASCVMRYASCVRHSPIREAVRAGPKGAKGVLRSAGMTG